MADCHFLEHLSWHVSRKSPAVFASLGCLLSGNMESTLPENTDKKMFVCFRHIKVERLAQKKSQSLKCLQKNLFFLLQIHQSTERKRFDIRGKNQMMLSTFLSFHFINRSGHNSFFNASHYTFFYLNGWPKTPLITK